MHLLSHIGTLIGALAIIGFLIGCGIHAGGFTAKEREITRTKELKKLNK